MSRTYPNTSRLKPRNVKTERLLLCCVPAVGNFCGLPGTAVAIGVTVIVTIGLGVKDGERVGLAMSVGDEVGVDVIADVDVGVVVSVVVRVGDGRRVHVGVTLGAVGITGLTKRGRQKDTSATSAITNRTNTRTRRFRIIVRTRFILCPLLALR